MRQLAAAQAVLAQRRQEADDAARELRAAIVAAARGGVMQRAIVDATGLSREHVRRICRDAGYKP